MFPNQLTFYFNYRISGDTSALERKSRAQRQFVNRSFVGYVCAEKPQIRDLQTVQCTQNTSEPAPSTERFSYLFDF